MVAILTGWYILKRDLCLWERL